MTILNSLSGLPFCYACNYQWPYCAQDHSVWKPKFISQKTKLLSLEREDDIFCYTDTIEWFGLKGMLKIISFQPATMDRDTFHKTRLLKAPSNLAMTISWNGASRISLGHLLQCLTSFIIENFFLIANLDLPLPVRAVAPCPITTYPCKKATSLLGPFRYWKALQGLPRAFSSLAQVFSKSLCTNATLLKEDYSLSQILLWQHKTNLGLRQ